MKRKSPPSKEVLIEFAYQFYPRGIHPMDAGYEDTAEWKRYKEISDKCRWDRDGRWARFLDSLETKYPQCVFWDLTVGHGDGCYYVRIYHRDQPEDALEHVSVCCAVSYLAPVYAIYVSYIKNEPRNHVSRIVLDPSTTELAQLATALAAEVEAEFDAAPFPVEYMSVPMPDVVASNHGFGEATLFNCLFIENLW